MAENVGVAEQPLVTELEELEERFFQRGVEEDRVAREQLRQQLSTMPRWPGLGWAVGLVVAAMVTAAAVLFLIPPLR
jgi:hypothetical protein